MNQKTVGDYECVGWFGSAAITSTSASLMLASINLDSSEYQKSFQIIEIKSKIAVNSINFLDTKKSASNNLMHHKISPNNSIIIKCGDVISHPPPVWSYYK